MIPAEWVELTLRDGTGYRAVHGHLAEIKEAYAKFHEQLMPANKYHADDEVLTLTLINGDELTISAGHILYFTSTSYESHVTAIELNKAFRELAIATDPGRD